MDITLPTTAGQLGIALGATVIGNENAEIQSFSAIDSLRHGALSYLSERKFVTHLRAEKGAVVLTTPDLVVPNLGITFLVVSEPKAAFVRVLRSLDPVRPSWEGVSTLAIIHPETHFGDDVVVAPSVIIERGVRIGSGSVLYPFTYVGEGTCIGQHCTLYPNVTLHHGVTLGHRVKVYSGAVIGSDGFGYFQKGGFQREVPQIGTVVIEDDVRIGAHVTIDRGTLGETRIGARTKLDNHVHIAHNCFVGRDCLLCAFVGLAGSVTLGDGVVMGGQVGVGPHVKVGSGARIAGQTGVGSDLAGNETYFLTPAVPQREAWRIVKYMRKLPEIWKRLILLEQKLERASSLNERT